MGVSEAAAPIPSPRVPDMSVLEPADNTGRKQTIRVQSVAAARSALNPWATPFWPRVWLEQTSGLAGHEPAEADIECGRSADCSADISSLASERAASAVTGSTGAVLGAQATGEQAHLPGWVRSAETRAKVQRVLDELEWWYSHGGRPSPEPSVPLTEADTAEDLKGYLLQFNPRHRPGSWAEALSLAPALWNRISLHHLRFGGQRYWYVVLHTLDQAHRLLVLRVPPRHFSSEQERYEHARRQATYHDDRHGRFAPGLRVRDEFLQLLTAEELQFARAYVDGGHEYQFVEVPRSYRRRNYASYEEHQERSRAEVLRQVEAGWLEGPLLYVPRVVHPQAGVYVAEKDKYRPVVDASASGLNACLKAGPCKYAMVRDVVRKLKRRDWQWSFDYKDAFYFWPRRQHHCDYQGIQGPRSHPHYYRMRYLCMGTQDSPAIQQSWADINRAVVNRTVLGPLAAKQCGEQGSAEVAGMYVDDGKGRAAAVHTQQQAEELFQANMLFNEQYGWQDSPKKREPPARQGGYLGLELDTETMVASLPTDKAAKYSAGIEEVLQEHKQVGTVGRKQLARITGKLQFAADVARELQGLLPPVYRARDSFVGDYVDPWAETTRVRLGQEAVQALQQCKTVLAHPDRCHRRWYEEEDQELAGFWTGQCKDSHAELDRTSETRNGIPVYTGDAAGRGGGSHYRHLRLAWVYPPHLAAPNQSSNYRELDTVLRPLRVWGRRWRKRRVLVRSDNTTAVAVVNRGGTMQPNLAQLSAAIQEVCRELDIDLAAIHIPGVANKLADALSRFVRRQDHSDWMLHRHIFQALREAVQQHFLPGGQDLTLDACADPVGNNAQLDRFCSVVDSVYERDLAGEHTYANPDYSQIDRLLGHFLEAYNREPTRTSGTFVIPEWMSQPWWKLLKGARVIARYPTGSRLFTSPDWRLMQLGDGAFSYDPVRADRGPSRWPVLMVHYPTVLAGHRCAQVAARVAAAHAPVAARLRGGRAAGSGMLVLSGSAALDAANLRGVQ